MYRENRGINPRILNRSTPRLGRSVPAETALGTLSVRRWMVKKIGKSRSSGGTEPGPCSSRPDQATSNEMDRKIDLGSFDWTGLDWTAVAQSRS